MAEGFQDETFPLAVAMGSRGGPVRRTEVVTLASGHEKRTARWSQSRRRWEAGTGIRCRADMEAVLAFFEAREGRRFAFRWRDPFDHSSGRGAPGPTDQTIGTGDGQTMTFRLQKSYGGARTRTITRPVAGTVRVAVDGIEVEAGTDPATGRVTLAVPPAPGAVVTAGFLFDVPVRFDTDELVLSLEPGGAEAPDLPIVEVREA